MKQSTRGSERVAQAPAGALEAETGAPSALGLVLRTPFYLGATVALFLSGLGTSAAAPQIASFLVVDLHASLSTAGLFYLTNLTAPVAGYLVGARSDRTGRRLGLFRVCAAAGALGWAVIAASTQVWVPFVVSAVVLGFAGAATSQLFAALHDELAARPSAADDGVVSVVRMALTGGWVIGPVAGAFLAAHGGLRVTLLATGLATLAQVLPLGRSGSRRPGRALTGVTDLAARPARPGVREMLPLLAFTAIYICVYAGESIKYAYLPLYMNKDLHLPPSVSGAVIGIQPLVELVLMPVAAVVASKTGMVRLMVLAAALGVAANTFFATAAGPAALFAGQVLMGGVWGIFAALGIIVAQRLLPAAVATASAIFMSSTALSSALGGVTGGVGVATIGLPHVFLIPATLAAVAVVGLLLMARRERAGL